MSTLRNKIANHRAPLGIASIALAAGLAIGNNVSEFNDTQTASPRAIERGLNGDAQIAKNAVVAVGTQLTFIDPPVENAIHVRNPIKFDDDTYGYFMVDGETGKVDVETIDLDETLPLARSLGHSSLYQHEVMTELTVIYSDAPKSTGGISRYSWVVMGNQPGNVRALEDTRPAPKGGDVNSYLNMQLAEISSAAAGQVVYGGK